MLRPLSPNPTATITPPLLSLPYTSFSSSSWLPSTRMYFRCHSLGRTQCHTLRAAVCTLWLRVRAPMRILVFVCLSVGM